MFRPHVAHDRMQDTRRVQSCPLGSDGASATVLTAELLVVRVRVGGNTVAECMLRPRPPRLHPCYTQPQPGGTRLLLSNLCPPRLLVVSPSLGPPASHQTSSSASSPACPLQRQRLFTTYLANATAGATDLPADYSAQVLHCLGLLGVRCRVVRGLRQQPLLVVGQCTRLAHAWPSPADTCARAARVALTQVQSAWDSFYASTFPPEDPTGDDAHDALGRCVGGGWGGVGVGGGPGGGGPGGPPPPPPPAHVKLCALGCLRACATVPS